MPVYLIPSLHHHPLDVDHDEVLDELAHDDTVVEFEALDVLAVVEAVELEGIDLEYQAVELDGIYLGVDTHMYHY